MEIQILMSEEKVNNGVMSVFCHVLYGDDIHFGHWLLPDEIEQYQELSKSFSSAESLIEIMKSYEAEAKVRHENSLDAQYMVLDTGADGLGHPDNYDPILFEDIEQPIPEIL